MEEGEVRGEGGKVKGWGVVLVDLFCFMRCFGVVRRWKRKAVSEGGHVSFVPLLDRTVLRLTDRGRSPCLPNVPFERLGGPFRLGRSSTVQLPWRRSLRWTPLFVFAVLATKLLEIQ